MNKIPKGLLIVILVLIILFLAWKAFEYTLLKSLYKDTTDNPPLPLNVIQDKLCPEEGPMIQIAPLKCDHGIYVQPVLGVGYGIFYDSQGNEIVTCPSYSSPIDFIKCLYLKKLSCERFCPETETEDETAGWQTYRWVEKCGNFEIMYPSDWKTQEIRIDSLGCTGELYFIPDEYSSFSQAVDANVEQAAVLNMSYSETSAVAETTFRNLEKNIKESPQKYFSPGILQCIKENSRKFFSIECGITKDKEIYFISGDIIKFDNQINQILSTFKFLE